MPTPDEKMHRIRRLDALAKMLEVEGFDAFADVVRADVRGIIALPASRIDGMSDVAIANEVRDAHLYGAAGVLIERTA